MDQRKKWTVVLYSSWCRQSMMDKGSESKITVMKSEGKTLLLLRRRQSVWLLFSLTPPPSLKLKTLKVSLISPKDPPRLMWSFCFCQSKQLQKLDVQKESSVDGFQPLSFEMLLLNLFATLTGSSSCVSTKGTGLQSEMWLIRSHASKRVKITPLKLPANIPSVFAL